ncbi:hypothetical protein B0H11DRAFT_1900513 [Mycena galericulata]|nr:hypothetical protein B0H11DRAFT_1900513 [Mycena galericulata]
MGKVSRLNGRTITKTKVKDDYKLGGTDLNSIDYMEKPNPYRKGSMTLYSVADVEALAARIQNITAGLSSPSGSGSLFAMPNGRRIVRAHALADYTLADVQLDRIKPISEEVNPRGRGPVRYYNVCDVQELANAILEAGAVPAASTRARPAARRRAPPTSRYHNRGYDDDRNVFDGMSGEEAAFNLAALTGIVGPAMSYCQD